MTGAGTAKPAGAGDLAMGLLSPDPGVHIGPS